MLLLLQKPWSKKHADVAKCEESNEYISIASRGCGGYQMNDTLIQKNQSIILKGGISLFPSLRIIPN